MVGTEPLGQDSVPPEFAVQRLGARQVTLGPSESGSSGVDGCGTARPVGLSSGARPCHADLGVPEPETEVVCFFVLFCFVFLPFLGPLLWHTEVPRLGVLSEL